MPKKLLRTISERVENIRVPATTKYWNALSYFVKAYVGPGALTLNMGFHRAGLGLGIVIMTFVVATTTYNSFSILMCHREMRKHTAIHTYKDLTRLALGRGAEAMYEVFTNMLQLGVCSVYFSFIAENLNAMIEPSLPEGSMFASRLACFLYISPMFVAGGLLPTVASIAPFMGLANFLIVAPMVVVVAYSITQLSTHGLGEGIKVAELDMSAPLFFGTVSYCMAGITSLFPLEQSMANKDEIWSVVGFGFAIIISLYVAVGVLPHIAWPEAADAPITAELTKRIGGSLLEAGDGMIILSVILTYPAQLFPAAELWQDRCGGGSGSRSSSSGDHDGDANDGGKDGADDDNVSDDQKKGGSNSSNGGRVVSQSLKQKGGGEGEENKGLGNLDVNAAATSDDLDIENGGGEGSVGGGGIDGGDGRCVELVAVASSVGSETLSPIAQHDDVSDGDNNGGAQSPGGNSSHPSSSSFPTSPEINVSGSGSKRSEEEDDDDAGDDDDEEEDYEETEDEEEEDLIEADEDDESAQRVSLLSSPPSSPKSPKSASGKKKTKKKPNPKTTAASSNGNIGNTNGNTHSVGEEAQLACGNGSGDGNGGGGSGGDGSGEGCFAGSGGESGGGQHAAMVRFVVLRVSMVAFTGVASFLVPDLEKLLSVIGALAGSLLAVVFPALISLKCRPEEHTTSLTKILDVSCAFFGIVGGLWGAAAAFVN